MADYKLSYTAEEVEEKLKKIEDGGVGYTENETVHKINSKYLPHSANIFIVELRDLGITGDIFWSGIALPLDEKDVEAIWGAAFGHERIFVYDRSIYQEVHMYQLQTSAEIENGEVKVLTGLHIDPNGDVYKLKVLLDYSEHTATCTKTKVM